MKIILNEKEYAEKCLREKTVGDNAWQTAQILAKYYYHELGYRKARIQKALNEFLLENYSLYRKSRLRWEENVESLAASAGKYDLFQQYFVPITRSELETISGCGLSKQHQQVLFSYLCLAKLGNLRNEKNNGWVGYKIYKTKDVFQMAHVSVSEVKQDFMINDFYIRNLVELPKKNDNLSVRVTFCDNDGDCALAVSDFRDLGYLYLQYIGENIVACQQCGILMRGNKAGTKKYCKGCAGYVPQEFKIITCVDCGKQIKVSAYNTESTRCSECQAIHKREAARLRKQRQRQKEKDVTLAFKS